MLTELPKLLGKSFAIGFFLPAAALLLTVQAMLGEFRLAPSLLQSIAKTDTLLGATTAVFTVWMAAVTLMALNRPIIRFLEGYGRLNPLRVLAGHKRRAFDRLALAMAELRQGWDEADLTREAFPADRQRLYGALLLRAAQEFPDSRDFVLPTRFGNAIRAFEIYSRVIYGLEGIHGWTRLSAVIPADYRQMIEDAKAQMDFWINLWVGGLATAALYGAFWALTATTPDPWIPAAALVAAFLAARGALMATGEWGMLIMSGFDLFRGELCRKLGLKLPATIQEERAMWRAMSQAMVYRSKDAAEQLSRFRDAGAGGAKPAAGG